MMTYREFLDRKKIADEPTGISVEPYKLSAHLFPFQRDIVAWALRRGRAAIFADCGLGKTLMQLEWARHVALHTGRPVLILAPLAVAAQTNQEGIRFGIMCNVVESQEEIRKTMCPDMKPYKGVFITNYEKLHRFDPSIFAGVVLDEGSILKAYDGKTRTHIIKSFARTPFKLAATATPAPNDFMELGNHSEFLGVMTRSEMLSMFFVHDGGDTSKWRLKGHAETAFWQWICSWAVNIRKPSDLGYSDDGYALPDLRVFDHIIEANHRTAGLLFTLPASSLQERREARRASLDERVKFAADLAKQSGRKTLIWCNLNDEQDGLEEELAGLCVSIRGATPDDDRISMEREWRTGSIPYLISKPEIFGWGLNWQHCAREIFCGISDSYEQIYQAIRRCWRFGQLNPVEVHFVLSELEQNVLQNIKRKQEDADRMAAEMVNHMAEISSAAIKGVVRTVTTYQPTKPMEIPQWLKAA